MEQHKLTKKEYDEIHKLSSEKRAVMEMLEFLKAQLSSTIVKEDRWWKRMAKKYELDTQENVYRINHAEQEIVGLPRPQRNTKQQVQPVENPPSQQAQPQPDGGIRVRERTPEMNKLVSAEELEAMRAMNNKNKTN